MTEPLPLAWSGHRVLLFDRLGSTNSHARDGVEQGRYAPGDVVLANEQTAGRGRRGRQWIAPPGRALTVSIVTQAPPGPRPGSAAILAAVAAARAIEATGGGPIDIKWPNDLMREDRKVGGLLLESAARTPGLPLLVIGIGINLELRPGDLPADVAWRADGAGVPVERRDDLCKTLLREVALAFEAAVSGADSEWRAEYCRRSWLDGKFVRLRAAGESWSGRVERVTGDGDLLLEDGRRLRGETVELEAVPTSP